MFTDLLWVVAVATNPDVAAIDVPEGRAIVLDGRCDAVEWRGAARAALPKGVELLAQQRDGVVSVCLRYATPMSVGVDLFLATGDGAIRDLHASAKVAERTLTNGEWPEWEWWNNVGWSANAARPEEFKELKFLPSEATEFSLRRERFGGDTWRVRIDVHSREPFMIYPPATVATDPKGWFELRL